MNDAHLFPRDRTIDLSRLNEAQRHVLRLLAEGHTAKSVANTIGSTPAAVNERLREARQKTGVGSSRELARMLRAQENRDEQSAAGAHRDWVADDGEPTLKSWWRQDLDGAMFVILVAVLAAVALVVERPKTEAGQQAAARPIFDPQLGTFMPEGPAWLYPVVRKEYRDPDWAPEAEQLLHDRYSKIGLVGAEGSVLRVQCGNNVCEVAASIAATDPKNLPLAKDSQINWTQQELLSKALHDDMKRAGLVSAGELLTSAPDKPDRALFLAYYSRAK